MRYGYWLPVFGGWLRNVPDEGMSPTWDYVKRLAQRSEQIGFDITLIAELFMNDIKGIDADSLEAWSTAAALAAVTERLELMVAVRPTFHEPAIFAKQAANIDHISGGRLALNVVSSWWKDEARRYGIHFEEHDDRYARTDEWLGVVNGVWSEPRFSYSGSHYKVEETILEPKPLRRPRPTIYAGDAYVMHGDPPERVAPKIADMTARREKLGLGPMQYGVAAYAIVRNTEDEAQRELERITNVNPGSPGYQNYQDWIAHTALDQQVSLEDYSVSNRGLRAGLVGTPEQVADRIRGLEAVGVDLLLLQFSPQLEEMERFSETVMPLLESSAVGADH